MLSAPWVAPAAPPSLGISIIEGKIDKIWRGNAWTPAEVVKGIQTQR
jgi:hypothetical protein